MKLIHSDGPPASTFVELSEQELVEALREYILSHKAWLLPRGGLFDIRFHPVNETLTLVHTP